MFRRTLAASTCLVEGGVTDAVAFSLGVVEKAGIRRDHDEFIVGSQDSQLAVRGKSNSSRLFVSSKREGINNIPLIILEDNGISIDVSKGLLIVINFRIYVRIRWC